MYYLGVDLGGTNIKAALVDADGAIIKEASTPTKLPRPAEAVCDDIAALCNQLAQGQQVAGIGVGCPGTVDGGLVRYSNNLDWHDFAMGDYLRARTGLPVALANDANAAALGEALAGCAKGAESAVIITLGTGVGGGVVLGGKLLTGYTGAAAEPGHMVILDMAKGRDLTGGNENIIAVIGDGSLSGGEAFEGLDYAAELGTNMIIIVNDNQMSIAENHGGLYRNLKELRDSNGQCECNFFKAMGLDYIYVNEGNDVQALIEAFSKVKDIQHPIVVHINTLKGKGYERAEQDKETYHWRTPFNPETGEAKVSYEEEDYSEVTAQYLLKKMKEDSRVVTITSGTPAVLGFTPDRRQEAGKQFVDVGIAEEHAVALASGIAANGGKPVYGVYSTFIQRSYDQLSQDLCINNNPAVLLVFWGTLSGMNDVTHLCFFDIPLISNIPNMVYLAPTYKEEYLAMLEWSIRQNEHPVAIRVPATDVITCGEPVETDYSVLNRYKVTHRGSKVAILALGSFYGLGQSVASLLKEKANIDATLINPRYITGVDNELMDELKADHELVITLEDGVLDGGFGEKIARYYGATNMKVLNFGAKKEFVDRYDIQEFLRANHLTDEQIVEDITAVIG